MQNKYFKQWIIGLAAVICFQFPVNAQQSDPAEFMGMLEQARKLTGESKWAEATPLWIQLAERNPVNGEFLANLANAHYNTGQFAKSIEAYKKQIDLGYGRLEIAAYNIACCYALMGEKKAALDWLEKAFGMGFKTYQFAQNDSDLKSLHTDLRFIKIVAMEDVSKMSRTEGWRYDLELLK